MLRLECYLQEEFATDEKEIKKEVMEKSLAKYAFVGVDTDTPQGKIILSELLNAGIRFWRP